MSDQTVQPNPLLDRLQLPGETFRLPSQGLFYHNGELSEDTTNGEVHVFPMTTIDELMFRTPDLLYSGKAIDTVFGRCIPQVKKPQELLIKDVDYLLTCLRLITYGPTMAVTYTHTCADAKEQTYDIKLQPLVKQARAIDPTTIASSYSVKLGNGQTVKIRPTLFKTALELSQTTDFTDKVPSFDEVKKSLLTVIADTIDNIDDINDRKMIAEWIDKAPAGYIREIVGVIEKTGEWGVDFNVKEVCKDCEGEIEVSIGTNPIMLFS